MQHDGIPFHTVDGEGRKVDQELMPSGEISTTKISNGDPNADGIYEEWSLTHEQTSDYHVVTERRDGATVREQRFYQNGTLGVDIAYENNGRDHIKKTYRTDGQIYHIEAQRGNDYAYVDNYGDGIFKLVIHEHDRFHEEAYIEPGNSIGITREYVDAEGRQRVMRCQYLDGTLTELTYDHRKVTVDDYNRLYLPNIAAEDIYGLIEAEWADGGALITPISNMATKWTDGQMRFSVQINPNLSNDISDALRKRDPENRTVVQKKRHDDVVFSDDIPFFEFLGLPNLRVVSDVTRVRKINQKHNLSAEQIADLPNRYNSPVAVAKDGDAYIVLTDMLCAPTEGESKPVHVVLKRRTLRTGEAVFLATAMAETADEEVDYYKPLFGGNLLFADENKIAGLKLEEETESILRTQASGNHVLTASDYSAWSTVRNVPQSGADVNGGAANALRGKLYNQVSQIGKAYCRGGGKRQRGRRIEIARERKSNEREHAPMGASREKQEMAPQSMV